MSVTYGFYDSLNGDRKYSAKQISELFDGLIRDGVFTSIGDALAVSVGGGMNIIVGTGRAWFNHTWTYNDSPLILQVDQSEIALNRVDSVVLEVNSDVNVRANTIKIVKGVPSSEPVPTELVRNEFVNQYPLAYIYVSAGATEITSANIENKIGSSDCPFVDDVHGLESIKDAVDNLLNLIEAHKAEKAIDENPPHGIEAILTELGELKGIVERNVYDDYLRTLELYYTGHFSGPAIDGMRAMMFDGFVNTSLINEADTDAAVTTTAARRGVRCKTSIISTRPTDIQSIDSFTTIPNNKTFSSLSNAIDTSITTKASCDIRGDGWTDFASVQVTIPSLQVRKRIKIRMSVSKTVAVAQIGLRGLQISPDGNTWYTVLSSYSSQDVWNTTNTSGAEATIDVPPFPPCKYARIQFRCTSNDSLSTSPTIYLHDILLESELYSDSTLYVLPKTIIGGMDKATIYYTALIPGQCNISLKISNDGGATWKTASVSSSRNDPLVEDYTEHCSVVEFEQQGNTIVLKFELSSTDGFDTPVLKRYGVLW